MQVAPGLGEPVECHALHVLARPRRAAVLVEVDAAVGLLRRPDRTEHLECVIGLLRHAAGSLSSGFTSIPRALYVATEPPEPRRRWRWRSPPVSSRRGQGRPGRGCG